MTELKELSVRVDRIATLLSIALTDLEDVNLKLVRVAAEEVEKEGLDT